jgi:hypothetical protein
LRVEWHNTGAQRQKALLFLLHHLPLNRAIGRAWASALDRYAQEEGAGIGG